MKLSSEDTPSDENYLAMVAGIRDAVQANMVMAQDRLAQATSPQEQATLMTHLTATVAMLEALANPPKVKDWSDFMKLYKVATDNLGMKDNAKSSGTVDWTTLKATKPGVGVVIDAEVVTPTQLVERATENLFVEPELPKEEKPDFRKPDGSFDRAAMLAWSRARAAEKARLKREAKEAAEEKARRLVNHQPVHQPITEDPDLTP